jgi:hypothetical protein
MPDARFVQEVLRSGTTSAALTFCPLRGDLL